MGDMGEVFNAMREASKEKRASNRETSAQKLTDMGISFESKNHGAHLIVEGRYDFWPGTGLWIDRTKKKGKRGVRSLIKQIRSGQ